MDILGTSLNRICNTNCHVWLAGDFNLSGFDWLENNIKPNCQCLHLHEQFLGILDDNGLTQIIDIPTRHNDTLDLFVTNNPSLIQSTQVIPGLADHEAVVVEGDLSPITNRHKPR